MPTLLIDTNIQGGSYNPSTGVWTAEVALAAAIGGTLERWCQFDHAPLLALELKGGPLVTGLTIQMVPTFTQSGTLRLYTLGGVMRRTDFATGAPPRPLAPVLLELAYSFTALAPHQITVPLNFVGVGNSTAMDHQLVHRIADPSGQLRTALGVTWSGAGGDIAVHGFNITYEQGFTGLVGPWRAFGRADECPRCGKRETRDKWVRDGYLKMMVCHRCWDPEDPVGRRWPTRGERPAIGEEN